MAKITAALILVFAIELSMFLVINNPSTHTSLFSYIVDPSNTLNNPFYNLFTGQIGQIASIGAVVVGFFFILRTEVIYAGVSIVIIAFITNIVQVWVLIRSQSWFNDPTTSGTVATLITAPLFIFYLIATLDYIRQPG